MKRIIAFDVNETLLDLAALEPIFAETLSNERGGRSTAGMVRANAFKVRPRLDRDGRLQRLHDATDGRADDHRDAARRDDQRSRPGARARRECAVCRRIRTCDPGLAALRDAGFTLVTLTNSPGDVAEAQIANAGLSEFFSACASRPTRFGASNLPRNRIRWSPTHFGVTDFGQVRLVAAHPLGHRRCTPSRMRRRIRQPTRCGARPARADARYHRADDYGGCRGDHYDGQHITILVLYTITTAQSGAVAPHHLACHEADPRDSSKRNPKREGQAPRFTKGDDERKQCDRDGSQRPAAPSLWRNSLVSDRHILHPVASLRPIKSIHARNKASDVPQSNVPARCCAPIAYA